MKKNPKAPDFGIIRGNSNIPPGEKGSPYVYWSDLGKAVYNGLEEFELLYPAINKWHYKIMPDHIHLIIYKNVKNEHHLDFYIENLKGNIASNYNRLADRTMTAPEIFQEGYTDKPLYDDVVLDNWYVYLDENPWRRATILQKPDFFKRIHNLTISGKNYKAYGCPFLFSNPDKYAVRMRRRFTDAERRIHSEEALNHSEEGTVLVSPFVSPYENDVRKDAEKRGAKIIKISHEDFEDGYKPDRHDFWQCAKGNLLIISMGMPKGTPMNYAIATQMNELAAAISNSSFPPL